jgi:hypothetical protein
MITVLIPAATAAVARLNALVAGAALIKAVAPVEAALVEAALVEAMVLVKVVALIDAVALVEAVALVDAARVEAALVAGSICHRPPRNRQIQGEGRCFLPPDDPAPSFGTAQTRNC